MSWAETKSREMMAPGEAMIPADSPMGMAIRTLVHAAIWQTIEKCAGIAEGADCDGDCRGNLFIRDKLKELVEP